LYDLFSLVIWGAAIAGFVMWGRGFFCARPSPYGAMQELTHHAGRLISLRPIRVPARWNGRFKWVKYGVLAALTSAALTSPAATDVLVEVKRFKTAIAA
jgi:polyferredoxin